MTPHTQLRIENRWNATHWTGEGSKIAVVTSLNTHGMRSNTRLLHVILLSMGGVLLVMAHVSLLVVCRS